MKLVGESEIRLQLKDSAGPPGPAGADGKDYVLTNADKKEIAGMVDGAKEIAVNGNMPQCSSTVLWIRQGGGEVSIPQIDDSVISREDVWSSAKTRDELNQLSEQIEKKIGEDELGSAVEDALTQAKESGEFDGPQGPAGDDYVLTDEDKQEIVNDVLAALPSSGSGETYKLIADITIDEDVESLYIDKDSEGAAYDYKAISIEMFGGAGSAGNMRIEINNGKVFAGVIPAFTDGRYCFIRGIYAAGVAFYDVTHSAPNNTQTNSNGFGIMPKLSTENVKNVHFRGTILAGSTIKIWGMK